MSGPTDIEEMPPDSTDSPIPIALIGYGYWGARLARYIQDNDRLALRQVCSPSLVRSGQASIRIHSHDVPIAELTGILSDERVQAVVLATPINTHFDLAQTALFHGKHVFIEKPLCLNQEQALSLLDLSRKTGFTLHTDFTYTFSAAVRKAIMLLQQGAVGQLVGFQFTLKQLGRFMDDDVYALLGAHCLSLLGAFSPLSEFAVAHNYRLFEREGKTTAAMVCLESRDGVRGTIDINLHCPDKQRMFALFGSDGTLLYCPDREHTLQVFTHHTEPRLTTDQLLRHTETFAFDEGHNLKHALDSFANVVDQREPSNAQLSAEVSRLIEILH